MSYVSLVSLIEQLFKKIVSIFSNKQVEDLSLYSNNQVKYTICPTGEKVDGMCENCTCRPAKSSSKN